ncbi:hypothetical protein [Streptomyces sp. NBC_00878]|uniref:hypothetical protein n=1 Tax=Streptomyces sp. NBC_00878 TaxID=2975854 RepID=UPI002256E4D4|nr:hypothetical protein [Streptomyces sp. NBC_00878]MCX4911139.1 hypothetical protein [Streptomyces sp. NBC_00878]
MADHLDPPPHPPTVGMTLEQADVVFTPLMNKRYLRELARFRLLLASGARVSGDRAEALVRWWDTLTDVMTGHHRAMSEVFWSLLLSKGTEFDSVVASMETRYESLAVAQAEAGRRLTEALRAHGLTSSAQFPFRRFHDEMSALSLWEETEVLSRAQHSFTTADWVRVESFVLAAQAAQGRLEFVLPWLCDGVSVADADRLFSAFPASVARIHHSTWLPRFERFAAEAWPGLTPA